MKITPQRKGAAKRKLKKIFHEWKAGTLNIGRSKKKVPRSKRGHRQAIAIALSEQRRVLAGKKRAKRRR